jgi:hypothetical protein
LVFKYGLTFFKVRCFNGTAHLKNGSKDVRKNLLDLGTHTILCPLNDAKYYLNPDKNCSYTIMIIH